MHTLPGTKKEKRSTFGENLTPQEIKDFMILHGVSRTELAEILGVSVPATTFWLKGERVFSITNSRLIKLFCKYPQLIKEF